MAYISNETKAKLAPAIKAVLKKYGMKGTISCPDHSELRVTLSSGKLDLMRDAQANTEYRLNGYCDVNVYHYKSHFTVDAHQKFIGELLAAMRGDVWFDNTDIMTDYFDSAFYLSVCIGKWNKAYEAI